jgi:hypothetical protein
MNQEKSPFPFNLVEKMMPAFPMMAVMGWMIVGVALLVGTFFLSPAQAAFFSDAKALREGAASGSVFVQANVTRHVIETWLPQFKFFGLGLGLMAIVMALGTIAKRLRHMGLIITNHMPADLRPSIPPPPKTVRLFQVSTLMGLMILMVVLIIGIVLAVTVVPDYWNHSIANDLNTAGPGSTLLGQLGVVSSFAFWLNALRMTGMAFLFTGISLALLVIVNTLRLQAKLLLGFYQQASGNLPTETAASDASESQLQPSPGLAISAKQT